MNYSPSDACSESLLGLQSIGFEALPSEVLSHEVEDSSVIEDPAERAQQRVFFMDPDARESDRGCP